MPWLQAAGRCKSGAALMAGARAFAAPWKDLTVLPSVLPSSGSLLGPKRTATTPPMTTSSGRPRPKRPMVVTLRRGAVLEPERRKPHRSGARRGCAHASARALPAKAERAVAGAARAVVAGADRSADMATRRVVRGGWLPLRTRRGGTQRPEGGKG